MLDAEKTKSAISNNSISYLHCSYEKYTKEIDGHNFLTAEDICSKLELKNEIFSDRNATELFLDQELEGLDAQPNMSWLGLRY